MIQSPMLRYARGMGLFYIYFICIRDRNNHSPIFSTIPRPISKISPSASAISRSDRSVFRSHICYYNRFFSTLRKFVKEMLNVGDLLAFSGSLTCVLTFSLV